MTAVPSDLLSPKGPPGRELGSPALLIDRVSKSFVVGRSRPPVAAVTDVSMRLERGDIHGVLGPLGGAEAVKQTTA